FLIEPLITSIAKNKKTFFAMHWYQFYECIDTGDLYSCISPLFIMPLKSLSRNKNGHSRDCSLADRMDRVYEKDY
ncbi:MAG TPA: hypothetical protein VEX63_11175, partial [Flavisolibacter sp.]|nr:hypothetical protein [Flavisolibacter sp.]